jgi:phosphate starvation-inducible protein PhoH and related proteins
VQETTQVKIIVPGESEMVSLFGTRDELLKVIEQGFESSILVRGNEITITGEPQEAELVAHLFEELIELLSRGHVLTEDSVGRSIDMVKVGKHRPSQVLSDAVLATRTRQIRPKTVGQKRYVDAIRDNTVVFAIGPAGTGKTYLAVAAAINALQNKLVQRIILTRPAVEAGEHLGFLPGDIAAKVDPYLKPLYDALYEMLEPDAYARAMERGTIEVAPLAFMRGRTLNDSFIILDEAQNTTAEQMKMFLTRLGFGSRAVVTGDITQIDLPQVKTSGLTLVQGILKGIDGIAFSYLDSHDVVRHKLVQQIVEAYRVFAESPTETLKQQIR